MADLIDPKLQEQSSLLQQSIQASFKDQRGAVSEAAQQSGGRRSTSYGNALGAQFQNENSVISSIIADTLSKQIGIEEAQKSRDFTSSQNDLNRALQKEQYDRSQNFAETQYEDAKQYQEDNQLKNDIISTVGLFF